MAKKLGDVLLGIIFLTFLIGGFSLFVSDADNVLGLNSSSVSTNLNTMHSNAQSNLSNTESTFTNTLDNSSEFTQDQIGQLVEMRGADTSGLLSFGSKNVLSSFLNSISETLGLPAILTTLLTTLVAFVVGILFIRFFWGESRI